MKHRKGELAKKILFILAAGAMIPAALVAPNIAQVFMPVLRRLAKNCESNPFCIRRSLKMLKRKRLIDTKERKKETVFILTEEGRKRIIRGEFEKLRISIPKRWDRKWRFIIFDIPEDHKKARDALRMKLCELGFYPLQKSCFVHPFECRGEIDFITEFFGVSPFINYLIVEMFEGERLLRRHFELEKS